MTVVLDKDLRRELWIGGEPYVLTIAPDGLRLVEKGRRKGLELAWSDLVSGQVALAVALNASLAQMPEPRGTPEVKRPAAGSTQTRPVRKAARKK